MTCDDAAMELHVCSWCVCGYLYIIHIACFYFADMYNRKKEGLGRDKTTTWYGFVNFFFVK